MIQYTAEKKRVFLRRIIFFCLLFCLIFQIGGVFSYASTEPSGDEDPIGMEVIWNRGAAARVGSWLPVTVRLTASRPVTGTVRADIALENYQYYSIEESFSLSEKETGEIVFQIPVTYGLVSAKITAAGEEGGLYGVEDIAFNAASNYTDLYIGIITADEDAFDWCRNATLAGDNMDIYTRLTFLTADEIPENISGFGSFDILFLDGVSREQWSEAQKAAVTQWVEAGGILIVGNDSDLCRPVAEGETDRESYGGGLYVYCGFPLSSLQDLGKNPSDIQDFFQNSIGGKGQKHWKELVRRISYGSSAYWDAELMTSTADADRIPQVLLYAVMFIAYLLVLGPLLYFGLKKKKMQHLLRLSMISISILFAFIIYVMGSRTRYTSPFASYVSICDLSDSQIWETTYLSIQSPYHTVYTAELADGYEVSYLTDASMGFSQISWTEFTPRVQMIRSGEGVLLQIHDNVPFTPEYFQMNRRIKSTEGQGLKGELMISAEGLEGTVTNHTGTNLTHVSVWTMNRWVYVGDLPDGATVDLGDRETAPARYSYRQALIERSTGAEGYSSAVENEEAETAFWRKRVLQSINMDLGTEQAVIYGFPEEESRDMIVGDTVIEKGLTLYRGELPVTYTDGTLTYIPSLESGAAVLGGSADLLYGAVYENVNVIRYSFGEYEPEVLYAEWMDESLLPEYEQVFQGSMEFYNVYTRSYDIIEQKDRYERSELLPYIDADNGITIRWIDNSFDEYTVGVLLPLFSYTGRQIS